MSALIIAWMYWLRFGIFLRSGSILRRMSFDIVSPFRRTPKAAAGRSLASRFYQFNECLSCCYNSVVVTMLGSKNFGSIELFFDFTAFNVEVFRGYCLDFRQRLGVRVSFVETLLIFSAYLRQTRPRSKKETLLNLT